MRNLKNTILSTVLLTTASNAQLVPDFHIGISNSKVLDKTYSEFNLGYGFNKYFDSNIVVGTSIDFAYGSADITNKSIDVYTLSGDLKIGYAIFNKDLFLYAIGSGALQGIDNKDGAGFGYGAGVDYRITKNIALNLEYKFYNMTSSIFYYDYEKAHLNLKYTF